MIVLAPKSSILSAEDGRKPVPGDGTMSDTHTYASDVAFSPAVKQIQARKGSREHYAQQEQRGWRTEVDDNFAAFLAETNSFYLATASADGQPYIQHRGGPKGFLKVLDKHTLAFADFAGNRQYITLGHLKENNRAHIFILHFATQQRVKLWGRARVVEGDLELMERLVDPTYKAKPQRAIVFTLEAWDANCRQHIVPRYSEAEMAPAVNKLIARIKELEEEVARLKGEKS
jgi:predicted pyridoxine 5'-phosphate oxidase superfamily flavin-nucleotide-binding protein